LEFYVISRPTSNPPLSPTYLVYRYHLQASILTSGLSSILYIHSGAYPYVLAKPHYLSLCSIFPNAKYSSPPTPQFFSTHAPTLQRSSDLILHHPRSNTTTLHPRSSAPTPQLFSSNAPPTDDPTLQFFSNGPTLHRRPILLPKRSSALTLQLPNTPTLQNAPSLRRPNGPIPLQNRRALQLFSTNAPTPQCSDTPKTLQRSNAPTPQYSNAPKCSIAPAPQRPNSSPKSPSAPTLLHQRSNAPVLRHSKNATAL
jgi:hypothetical protein